LPELPFSLPAEWGMVVGAHHGLGWECCGSVGRSMGLVDKPKNTRLVRPCLPSRHCSFVEFNVHVYVPRVFFHFLSLLTIDTALAR
jgi:hypothetical protein